jgi:hypothetical protein
MNGLVLQHISIGGKSFYHKCHKGVASHQHGIAGEWKDWTETGKVPDKWDMMQHRLRYEISCGCKQKRLFWSPSYKLHNEMYTNTVIMSHFLRTVFTTNMALKILPAFM